MTWVYLGHRRERRESGYKITVRSQASSIIMQREWIESKGVDESSSEVLIAIG